jgi:hypothetical protein
MCFLKIIDNKKIRKNDMTNDNVYILHVKKYAIIVYSGLEIWYSAWWYVYITCQENYI